MQTILGANGTIGSVLAKELSAFTREIRLVSRNPKKVNSTDELFPADLSDPSQVEKAIAGSEVVYLLVGFDYNIKVWQEKWPKLMQATIDAACLKVMAERGQIKGGIVDGPLAFDVAMNPDAVKAKGIVSEVAGRADVLVGDTLETSNVMAKEFEQAKCLLAGVLIGANCPVVLTSRTDDKLNRLASVAIAIILLKHKRENAH